MKFLILLLLLGCSDNSSESQKVSSISKLNELYGIPGIAGAIYQKTEFKEIIVDGIRKFGTDSPLETTDKFHLGSCTKAMTSTIAAMMIEEGHLNWDTKVSDVLTDIEVHPLYTGMTFQTLLVHRAGLPAEHSVFHELKKKDPVEGRKLIAQRLLIAPPLSAPDKKYLYSNYSYVIAGHILEKISGESWESLMQKYLFDPLDMKSCGFGVTSIANELIPSSPWGHIKISSRIEARHFDNPAALGPASTVHCSLEDWGKFLTIHLNGYNGDNQILKADTWRKLHSVHPSKDSSYTYGGWHLLHRSWANGPTLSHNGSNTLNYAKVWIAPKKESFIVSTANIGGDDAAHATDDFIQELISKHLY